MQNRRVIYNTKMMLAGKIYYDYSRFVNILTCLSIQTDEIKHKLERLIDDGGIGKKVVDIRI
ncbi:hypothetical protein J9303_20155 [Bacillaceae bacterium Marseille-Q3522]|nr:hypothetical protein [Bacillaceae bacterium Marseille-Q3522]